MYQIILVKKLKNLVLIAFTLFKRAYFMKKMTVKKNESSRNLTFFRDSDYFRLVGYNSRFICCPWSGCGGGRAFGSCSRRWLRPCSRR